jgi:hypothetical protein
MNSNEFQVFAYVTRGAILVAILEASVVRINFHTMPYTMVAVCRQIRASCCEPSNVRWENSRFTSSSFVGSTHHSVKHFLEAACADTIYPIRLC